MKKSLSNHHVKKIWSAEFSMGRNPQETIAKLIKIMLERLQALRCWKEKSTRYKYIFILINWPKKPWKYSFVENWGVYLLIGMSVYFKICIDLNINYLSISIYIFNHNNKRHFFWKFYFFIIFKSYWYKIGHSFACLRLHSKQLNIFPSKISRNNRSLGESQLIVNTWLLFIFPTNTKTVCSSIFIINDYRQIQSYNIHKNRAYEGLQVSRLHKSTSIPKLHLSITFYIYSWYSCDFKQSFIKQFLHSAHMVLKFTVISKKCS